MSRTHKRIGISIGVVAILCCALAAAAVEQHSPNWNPMSHFAQIRAFDHGTPIIDRYRHTTGDRAIYKGHYYSDKAPGVGFLLTPVYAVVKSLGIVDPNGLGMLHILTLFGATLPFLIIMLLAYRMVAREDPDRAAITAVTLGLGTLLLPFATILFSHVLSACMGFIAFFLLMRWHQSGARRLWPVAVAGLLGGYAIGTEYPLALLVAVLGLFVLWRSRAVKPVLVYGAFAAVGLIPLALYDLWAFGSPFHLSYQYVAANSSGVLGLGAPSLWSALKLLISGRGLFIVTPVIAAAIAGMVVLYREGRRVEVLLPAAMCAVYFVYNTTYYLPFGGAVPGPRFLITILPFLAVPLAAAYRRAPLATLSLALVSAGTMMTATVTVPMLSLGWSTNTWWHRLELGYFGTRGVTPYLFAGLALIAIVCAARATPRPRISGLDLKLTALALGSWYAIQRAVPPILAQDSTTNRLWGLAALVAIGVALIAVLTNVAMSRRLAWLAALPLLAIVVRRLDHTALMLCLAGISLGLLLALARLRDLTPDSLLPSGSP